MKSVPLQLSRKMRNAAEHTMKPGGTGNPTAAIRLRLAPFPPAMAGAVANFVEPRYQGVLGGGGEHGRICPNPLT